MTRGAPSWDHTTVQWQARVSLVTPCALVSSLGGSKRSPCFSREDAASISPKEASLSREVFNRRHPQLDWQGLFF